jgi:HEXXH motif-containing protein
MTLFIGENSILEKISLDYFSKLNSAEINNHFLNELTMLTLSKKSFSVSAAECSFIYKMTYLDPTKPFGLVCKKSRNGKVEINAEKVNHFNKKLESAIQHISKIKSFNELFSSSLRSVVPLGEIPESPCLRKNGSGFSAHWLKGAVFLSLPQEHPFPHLELAINLVHEMGHQALMFYQDADPIIEKTDFDRPVYSMIRKTFRPAIMSLHALVAIYFMYYFVHELLKTDTTLNKIERDYFERKKSQLTSDFSGGCFALKGIQFTPVGSDLLLEMINYFQESRAA